MDIYTKMKDEFSPIFVGGTGRSGTTIMADYLNSHSSLVAPIHENKLIVEESGVRSLVESLSRGYDYKGNHYAISRFISWANTIRTPGFRNKTLNFLYRGTNRALYSITKKRIPAAQVCRAFSFWDFSLIGVGTSYGISHYDSCVEQFLADVIGETDAYGIVDTEGLIKPVYSPSTSDREELLQHSRNFLNALNKPKMLEAGAQSWCDDTPLNALYAHFLLELYPTGKVVHMVRDPRDVAASYSEKSWASSDLELILNRLKRQYRELIKVEESLPKQSFRSFRLEDFAYEPDIQKSELCSFLGLDTNGFDGSVTFEAASFGRWKKKFSANVAQIVERQLSEVCAHFGYRT
ncbi:sulfotransferase family protein [Antarcticimicrobium sediminis]|uniref:Sulfotransferase n=1 Tax=Antarcticimicrobium sediminis TaxID=2546227 RepID=A0A4V2Z6Q4_9RHOB|nr:sulfotransferase [Antarcticimicrobium sediminis]TDE33636.1 sulfotransferase [Antarcticimicrobium sediminis]